MKASSENRAPEARQAEADGEKLLSVIVPVYNVLAYLDKCVESILAQSYHSLELLLVDDGSTDGSGARLDEWAERDARIRVIHKENGGQASAKNVGIVQAKGALIAFVDSDDWLDPSMYGTIIRHMEQNGATVGACGFNYIFPDHTVYSGGDTGQVTFYSREKALLEMALQRELMMESSVKVYARDVVGDARFPEGKLYEEVAFARQTAPRLKTVVYVDRPFYQYRQGRAGTTNSSFPPGKLAVVEECDAFVAELKKAGLFEAARGMEAFTLEHLIRMYANARACHAEAWIPRRLLKDYRTRFFQAYRRDNPYVRQARGMLFAISPQLYTRVSKFWHR